MTISLLNVSLLKLPNKTAILLKTKLKLGFQITSFLSIIMSQVFHGTYLSEIQIKLGILYFYLLNLASLPSKPQFNQMFSILGIVYLITTYREIF